MPDLDYAKVTGRFAFVVGDTNADLDDDPDTVWCDEGTIRFTPLTTLTKVAGGDPVPFTAGHASIDAEIDSEGYLTYQGKRYVHLVDLTSSKVNPQIGAGKATHKIQFIGVKANGTLVELPTTTMRITKDGPEGDGVNDITISSPVVPGSASPIYRGEAGPAVESAEIVAGDLVLVRSDGVELNAGELPVGPGGSDAGVAGYINTPGSQTETALAAAIASEIDAEDIPGQVADAVASDPDVIAAAAGLAASDAGLVRKVDPGIPALEVGELDSEFAEAKRDPTTQLIYRGEGLDGRAIELRGTQYGRDVDAEYVHVVGNTDYSWAAFRDMASGRFPELVLDQAGKVPAAILAAWAARMPIGAVTTWPIDIVGLAGQSNNTERGTLPAVVADVDDRILQWNPSTSQIETMGAGGTGFGQAPWVGSEFAREYVKHHYGRRVLVVPTALGSTGFVEGNAGVPGGPTYSWDRTNTTATTNLYARMIARISAAVAAAGSGARLVALLWSQGESDRGLLTESQYAAKLDDLIAQARIDLSTPALPVVIGSMTPETIRANTGGTAAINAALLDTPRRVQRTSYVSGPTDMPDSTGDIHWSPQGQAERARRMAVDGLFRAQVNLATGQPIPPQRLRVTRSGSEVTITWDPAPARVTAYTIQTSTDSGATWNTLTLPGPLATETTITVPANTPVWVRGSSTNEVGTSTTTREVHA